MLVENVLYYILDPKEIKRKVCGENADRRTKKKKKTERKEKGISEKERVSVSWWEREGEVRWKIGERER